jgi:hypothetical protein
MPVEWRRSRPAGSRARDPPRPLLLPRGQDWFDTATLLVLAVLASWVLALLLWRVVVDDRIWTGTDGLLVVDPMQYVAWIREAADGVLVANPYSLGPSEPVFLHPGIVVSAAPVSLGVAPSTAYLLWKPLAVLALFGATRAYVHRTVGGKTARRAALVLALFYAAPVLLLVRELDLGVSPSDRLRLELIGEQEIWPVFWLWGYPFTAIAVAALAASLLLYESDRGTDAVRPWAPILGLLCAWLQPWQGATLIAILVAAEAVEWLVRRRPQTPPTRRVLPRSCPRMLLLTVAATAAPLAYYAVLSLIDPSWELAGKSNAYGGDWPVWTVVISILPLALPAVLAYRRRPETFQHTALRAWPIVGLGLYWFIGLTGLGTFPLHSLQGLSLPLGILAALGLAGLAGRRPQKMRPVVVASAVGLLTIPAAVSQLADAERRVNANERAYFLTTGERDAMRFLERSEAGGGVFSTPRMGAILPALTGRPTFVGAISWTPDYLARLGLANGILAGNAKPADARYVIGQSRVRFVLTDCRTPFDLTDTLRIMLASVHRFGCAVVYQLRDDRRPAR